MGLDLRAYPVQGLQDLATVSRRRAARRLPVKNSTRAALACAAECEAEIARRESLLQEIAS